MGVNGSSRLATIFEHAATERRYPVCRVGTSLDIPCFASQRRITVIDIGPTMLDKAHKFEHTGSRYFPFNLMNNVMTPLSSAIGPAMNRKTDDTARAAGFHIREINDVFLDAVKTIHAVK